MRDSGDRPADLARAVGVTRAAVGYWLDGHTPKLETIKKIASHYGTSESWLLYGGDVMTNGDLDELLTVAIEAVESHLIGKDVEPKKKAAIITALFKILREDGAMPSDQIIKAMLQLAK